MSNLKHLSLEELLKEKDTCERKIIYHFREAEKCREAIAGAPDKPWRATRLRLRYHGNKDAGQTQRLIWIKLYIKLVQ